MKFVSENFLPYFCVLMLSFDILVESTIVSEHLPSKNPNFGGILAMNAIQRRQKRSSAFTKGTSFAIKGALSFPIKTVTKLSASVNLAHTIKLPWKKLYPEKGEKGRIDLFPGEFMDQELLSYLLSMSKGAVQRMGEAFAHSQKHSDLQQLAEALLKNENLLQSNWTNHVSSIGKSSLLNLMKELQNEMMFQDTLKRDRLRSREDRIYLYKDFESLLEKMGLPARPCLLRTICEIGEHPFKDSLFGELLNILMMASLGGRPEYPEEGNDYNNFVDAELYGRNVGQCGEKFKGCSNSVFSFLFDLLEDLFS